MKVREFLPPLVVSPWAVVPVVVVSGLGSSDAGVASDLVWGTIIAVTVILPMAYLGVLCIGLPAFLLLRGFGKWLPALLCLVGTAVPFGLFFNAQRPREAIVAAVGGLAVAATASLLLSRGRRNAL